MTPNTVQLRLRVFALAITLASFARSADALDGRAAFATIRFGVVGTVSSGAPSGGGFSATQIAPSWAVTAAHIAPAVGLSFRNDFGNSTVAEILSFPTRAPTDSPLPGALRDDLVLVRLAAPIHALYLPQLADDATFLSRASPGLALTLVSNNPDAAHRRYGAAELAGVFNRIGYPLVVSIGKQLDVVRGDSGSALFLGRIKDANASSVLIGVASAQGSTAQGQSFGVYTRIGAYRAALDAAVAASGETLNWATPPLPSLPPLSRSAGEGPGVRATQP